MSKKIHAYMPAMAEQMQNALKAAFPDRDIVLWTEPESFKAGLPDVEYLLTVYPPKGQWHNATSLKLLQAFGAGIDHLYPLDGLPSSVCVTNAAGLAAEPMGEFGLAQVLALLKRLNWAATNQRSHAWKGFRPQPVKGATLGILGCGRIGQALAQKAAALGMRVIGTQRTPEPAEHVDRMYSTDETETVMAQSDVVVCLLPLTHRTRGFIDESMMRRMKRGSGFVNLGRGGIVDEDALVKLLEERHLSGAAFDVFAQEPLPEDSPLWDAPNLLVTPHMAGLFPGNEEALARLFAENVKRVERGEAPLTPVNVKEGY